MITLHCVSPAAFRKVFQMQLNFRHVARPWDRVLTLFIAGSLSKGHRVYTHWLSFGHMVGTLPPKHSSTFLFYTYVFSLGQSPHLTTSSEPAKRTWGLCILA